MVQSIPVDKPVGANGPVVVKSEEKHDLFLAIAQKEEKKADDKPEANK